MNLPKWNGGKKEQILILLLIGILLLVIALPTQETQKDTEAAAFSFAQFTIPFEASTCVTEAPA